MLICNILHGAVVLIKYYPFLPFFFSLCLHNVIDEADKQKSEKDRAVLFSK